MSKDRQPAIRHPLLPAVLLALAFLSPLTGVWSLPGMPWYLPYGLWALVLLAAALLCQRHEP